MKKAICAFIAMMMIITPVMGCDHFGRDYERINGDIYYPNQTVYIAGVHGACAGFETFENCTVKIATSGEITFDGKTAPFYTLKYASSCWYQGMAWNNFPTSGKNPEEPEEPEFTNYTVMDFNTEGECGMFICVSTIKGAHSPEEFMVAQKGTWTSQDAKAHCEANGIEWVTILQYP